MQLIEEPLAPYAPALHGSAPQRAGRPRRLASVALLVLSLAALSTTWWHGHGSVGSSPLSFQYDGWAGWALPHFRIAAALWLVAAALLWAGRRSAHLFAAAVLTLAGLAIAGHAVRRGESFSTVTPAELHAIAIGTPRGQVEARLGTPMTTDASAQVGALSLPCAVYSQPGPSVEGGRWVAACFKDGRLARRLQVPQGIGP